MRGDLAKPPEEIPKERAFDGRNLTIDFIGIMGSNGNGLERVSSGSEVTLIDPEDSVKDTLEGNPPYVIGSIHGEEPNALLRIGRSYYPQKKFKVYKNSIN